MSRGIGRAPRVTPLHHLPFAVHCRSHRTPGTPISGGERCLPPPGVPARASPGIHSPGLHTRGTRCGLRGPVKPGFGVGGRGRSLPKLAATIASNSASTHTGSEQTSSANPAVAVLSATASRTALRRGRSRRVMASILDHFPATSTCSTPGHVPRLPISLVRTGDCVKR